MKKLLPNSKIVATLFLLFSLFFVGNVFGQITYTWTGTTSTAWNNTANWNKTSGASTPGTVATDIVIIPTTATNQPTLSTALATNIASLTFTSTTAATLTITGQTLNVTGAVTLNNVAGTSTACTITGTGTLSCASVDVGLTTVAPTGSPTSTMTSSIATFTISGTLALNGSRNGGGGTNRLNPTFTQSGGTVNVGNITTTVTTFGQTDPVTCTYTMSGTTPTLNITGATPFTLSATPTNTFTLNSAGATVNYTNLGAQTVGVSGNASTLSYTNLGLSGSGTKTLAAATTVSTALTVKAGVTLDNGGFALGTPTSITLENGTSSSTISGTGLLTLGGSVTVNNVSGTGTGALISCPVALGATRTFTVADETTTVADLTISGIVSTAFGLTKAGAGKMVLSGTNTYTGATLVSVGVLNLQNTSALGTAGGGTTVTSGAALELQGGFTFASDAIAADGSGISSGGVIRNISGNNTLTGAITINSTTTFASDSGLLTLNVAAGNCITATNDSVLFTGVGDITLADPFTSGTGTVTKSGTGILTLSAANTYSATTSISAGTLKLGNTGAFGTSSAITVSSGAVLDLNGITLSTARPLTLNGTGVASGGALTNTGGNASYSGAITLGSASTITATSSGTLTCSGTVGTGAFGLTLDGAGTGTMSGIISTPTSLTKNGAGTWTLSGLNTYTGATAVNAGTLKAGVATTGANGAFGNASAVTMANVASTILDITGFNNTIGSITGGGATGGNVTLGAATLTIGADSTSPAAYAGIISGTGAITKNGTGTLILSGSNTYSGLTTISAGTFKLGATGGITNTPLGTAGAGTTVTSGAVLDLAGFTLANTTTFEALTLNGTGISGSGALMNSGSAATYSGLITLGSASSIVGGTGTINVSNAGTITGATFGLTLRGAQGGTLASILGTTTGTLTKADAGTWTVSGSNTYSGLTTVSAGTLKLGATGGITNTPLGTAGAGTTVTSGAVLDLAGFTLANTTTFEALTLNGTGISNSGALMNSGSAATYSGLITLGSASSIEGGTGTINVSNAGTITGATFGLTLGGAQGGTLASILGTTSGTLTKEDAGTWTVSGSNTYSGLTTVSAGTLKLGATGGATNTPLGTTGAGTTVSSGAVLDLAGFTLANTTTFEALTLNGTGISGSGALKNSGSAATYSGLITLGSASSIVGGTGTINLSNAGTITGATFGLTLGGAQGGTLVSILGTTTGTLTKADAGTWTVSGANTYSGGTTVNAGIITLGSTTALGSTSAALVIASGAKANISNNVTVGSINLGGSGGSNGTWGSTTSSPAATFQNDTYFTNTKLITVTNSTAATPTVTPTVGTYTYTGLAQGPNAATNTGTGTSYTFSYVGVSGTTYGPSTTRPTNAGSYTVTASVATSTDGFWSSASSTAAAFSIGTRGLTITGVTANNKTYDGLTTATLSGTAAYSGLQNGETFAVTGTPSASFATATVGTGKTVTVTGYTAPSSNYTVTQPSLTANITTATLTITGVTANNKTYDGLTTATLSGTAAYSGLQNGETFAVTGTPSASFATATVGTGKTVTVTGYTAPSSNYTLTQPSLTADITTATLTITGITANNKTYDGLTTATLAGTAAYSGLQNGETFAVTGTPSASFATATVGTGKTVTVTGYTAPSSNYTVTQPSLTADITTATLTITGITANNKTYDGLTTATLAGTAAYSGLQNGETFSVTGTPSASFATATVGTGKTVTVTGYTAPSSNYTVTQPSLTADITTATLTITGITANNKTYDGLTTATLAGTAAYSGLQNGETFAVTGTPSASFATATVGTGKTVTVTGYTAPSSNYTLTQPSLTADITTATLTITGITANNKTYDGLTTATLAGTAAYSGLQNGETFAVTGTPSASFATATVGTGKTVTVTGYTAPSSNYTVTQPSLTADITTATLTITGITANNKTYDGLTTATLAGTAAYSGLQNGETFSVTGTPSASFATAAVGTGKTVTVTGYTAPSSNYTVTQPSLTADITTATLTITADDDTKVYGQTYTVGSGSTAFSSIGLQNSETIGSITIASSGALNTASVSTYSIVGTAATGGSFTASNYAITYVDGTLTVSPASLTITADDDTKVYGQTYTVGSGSTAFSSIGLQNSETIGSVTIASSGAVNTADVGTYSIVGSAATGGSFTASNYDITYVDGTLEVTPASLTITADDDTKVYGTTQSTPVTGATAFSSVGLQNTDAIDFVTLSYGSGALLATDAVGSTSSITPSSAIGGSFTASNYAITYVDGTLTVSPASLTITVDDDTKVYGQTYTVGSGSTAFSSIGLQNSETIGSITIASSGALNTASVSTYSIVGTAATGGSFTASNYAITYVDGTLTVSPASLTITVDDDTKVYGQTYTVGSGSTAFSSIGLQNSETIGSITIASSGAVNTADVGTYSIVGSAATGGSFTASNYDITYVDGTLEVTPASLTITADDDTKVYGTTQSTPVTGATAFSAVGLQNSDAIDFVTLSYGSGALLATDAVGSTSSITPSSAIGGSFTASNYDITYVDGTLEVTPASLTITADDVTKCYGTTYTLGTTAFTSVGLVLGETIGSVILVSTGDDSGAVAGNYPIEASSATGGTFAASNYDITYIDGDLTVQSTPTAGSIGSSQSICFNTTPSSLTSEEFGNGDGTITYRWEFNTNLSTPSWSTISGVSSATYSPSTLTQSTQYRRITISTLNSVACESDPTPTIQITVIPLPVIGTISGGDLSVCSGTNSVTLTLVGSVGNILWHYAVTEFGTYRPIWGQTSPTLVRSNFTGNSTTYFLAQVTNECTTTSYPFSNKIAVTVSNPDAGVISGAGTICAGNTKILTLSSSAGSVQWQSSTDNGVLVPFTAISGATSLTYSASPTTSTWYRVVVTAGSCGSATSASALIGVSGIADAGTIPEGDIEICKGSPAPLTLIGNSVGTIAWYKSVNGSSVTPTWTAVSGQTTTTLTSGNLTVTTWYKARVTNGSCIDETAIVQVTVSPTSIVKTISGTGTICNGASKLLTLVTGSIGTLQWQSSTTSATAIDFTDIVGANSSTYTASPIVTTWYRVVATSGVCSSATSAAIVVTVNQPSSVGTLSAFAPTICTGTGTAILLTTATGTIAWQKATVTSGIPGTYTAVTGNTSTTLSTGNLISSTAYRVVVTSGVCSSVTSNTAIVTVVPAAKITSITGFNTATTKACVGVPKTLTLSSGYVGTIEWLSSPTLTGTYTVIPGETASTYVYTPLANGVMYFKVRTTSSPCSAQAINTGGVAVFADTTICSREQVAIVSDEFEVVAYPNPSSSEFTLDIQSSNKGFTEVQVFDTAGRLIESRQEKSSSIELGRNYSSGVYNVIVNHGTKVKTLRLIKK